MGNRAGDFIPQPGGFRAFIPAPLPPNPPVRLDDGELRTLLSEADLALGRLDGITSLLPNPDLFVGMYVRREAVLSSQIEGTQASLTDLLQFEVGEAEELRVLDVEEVVNYVRAMNYGLERLETLPLSLRLIREIHEHLLQGVRGQHRDPGEFRRSQNWIGPSGSPLNNAAFVPPPPHELLRILGELETFLRDRSSPALIHAGLAHAQFETIHPFLDGNGRVGRLLITFLLCERKVLTRPLLYLSHHFKLHRAEYYDRLQAVRIDGNWEGWLGFFLRGVREVAQEAADRARKILSLREQKREALSGRNRNLLPLLDQLFQRPVVTVNSVREALKVTFATANKYVSRLQGLDILTEVTGYRRNRLFQFTPYLSLFSGDEAMPSEPKAVTLPGVGQE